MNILETFGDSPKHSNSIFSPKHQIGSYQEYFEKRLQQKQFQRSKNKSSHKKHSKHHSKSKSKLSKENNFKSNKSPQHVKKRRQQFKVDPLYASRVSQMLSQISIPIDQNKITKQQLRDLQNKIIKQILGLREQKILALQNLNKVVDKKNKAIQLTKSLQVLKQKSRLNTNDSDEDQQDNQIQAQFSKFQKNSRKVDGNTFTLNSRVSKTSKKSVAPKQLINSKLQQQINQIQTALNEAGKIRQQLMRPLYEHPLLQRNNELKQEYSQIKQQLQAANKKNEHNKQSLLSMLQQNQKLLRQLEVQKNKLASIQHKRFQTFFPQDKKKMEQMARLMETYDKLCFRKNQLQEQLMNGTIIRKAEDEIMFQQLREENRYLQQSCNRIMETKRRQPIEGEYSHMRVEQLEGLVEKQMQNKKIVSQMLQQFRNKIENLQRQNQSLAKKPRISYYY